MEKNKTLKLIAESGREIELIKESADPAKPKMLKFRGCFLVSDRVNGNNRVYPYEILKEEVNRFTEEMIKTDRAIMELEHPESSEINPMRASARILSLQEDNRSWIGEAVILASDDKFGIKGTPCGDVLASLINYGTKFGVSSRALGDVDDNGTVTDLHLVTCDTVLNPSIGEMVSTDGNRFVNGILESKTWVCNHHGEILECKYNDFEKKISTLPNTHISSKKNEVFFEAMKCFFDSLKSL